MLGITMSFRTKNRFIWNKKQLSEHGIDTRDLKSDNDNVFCNKIALNRFLENTNSENLYKTTIWKANSFIEQYKDINGTYAYLKQHLSNIYISDNIRISEIFFNNLSYKNNAFSMDNLSIPDHYYYSNKTQKGKYDKALKELKPYTYEMFSNKKIKCAVICPQKYEGTEEVFSIKLNKKLEEIFHLKIEFNKYYLNDTSLDDYKKVIYDNLIANDEKPDIVLVVLEEKQKNLNVINSPYYYCKAKLIGQGIPSQEILIKSIKGINDFILNNISLNIYAKIGGTAWTVEKIEKEKQEFIIGISSCFDKFQRKIFGVSQIFEYNGNYIVTDCTPLTSIQEYEKAFENYLEETLKKALLTQGNTSKEYRLIFHINKSPSNKYEIKAINSVISKFSYLNISYAIVHLNYNHNFRLFNNEGKENNRKGIYINIDENKTLLSLSDKSINPLLIDIDSRSTFKDKDCPLLSNIMLNELDKELEARGLNFVRYADDCIILVKSEKAANRVLASITKFIEKKLGLKVNAEKSKVTRPTQTKYLGFSFWMSKGGKWKPKPHLKSYQKLIRKLKQLTDRSWSISLDNRIKKINY